MPRQMPQYAAQLGQSFNSAIQMAEAGDAILAKTVTDSALKHHWSLSRAEFLYELAYIRMYIEWEKFLEVTFVRYLCGYTSHLGGCHFANGSGGPFKNLAAAEAAMLGNQQYILWHDPARMVQRSQRFFAQGFHEQVISSNASRLQNFSFVRHRIVHEQDDARNKFDTATMTLTGRRYRASRPGRFLRDMDRASSPHKRWLVSIGNELASLAAQIA